jgi:hypothetical protein
MTIHEILNILIIITGIGVIHFFFIVFGAILYSCLTYSEEYNLPRINFIKRGKDLSPIPLLNIFFTIYLIYILLKRKT